MLSASNLLVLFSLSWGIITIALVVLAMYRSTLSRREDDSLFLDNAERALMAGEQEVIAAKMDRLITPIKTLAVLSGTLLAAAAGLWLWAGYCSF